MKSKINNDADSDFLYHLGLLQNYIISEEYMGFDPYDALMSPLFKLPFFTSNKYIRFVSQQIVRRLPLNIRPLIGIKKSLNPVTLGLCLQALSYMCRIQSSVLRKEQFEKIKILFDKLIPLSGQRFSGLCWGYDFDWDGKYIRAKAFYPTVVATGIVVNALFEVYKEIKQGFKVTIEKGNINNQSSEHIHLGSRKEQEIRGDEFVKRIEESILSAAGFVRKDLKKTYYGDTFCYSYSPGDEQSVLNASMKGVRILTQAFYINNDFSLIDEAEKAVKFVCYKQNKNGSWVYSIGDARKWSDSYHTGYILDCLQSFINISGKKEYLPYLEKGFDFFKNSFIGVDGLPKYYSNNPFPVDCTSAAQIILTLCNFEEFSLAEKIINYMILNMQSDKGYFYYQKGKYFTNKISYMRWSNAWMFVALSRFLGDKMSKR